MPFADLSYADLGAADFSTTRSMMRTRLHGIQGADVIWGPARAAAWNDDAPLRRAELWKPSV